MIGEIPRFGRFQLHCQVQVCSEVNAKRGPGITEFGDPASELASDTLGEDTGRLSGGHRESLLPLLRTSRLRRTDNVENIGPCTISKIEFACRPLSPSHLASRARARIGIFFRG